MKVGHLRARITLARDLRQVRGRDRPVQELRPVDLPEPRVREHIPRAVLQVACAATRLALHQARDEVRRVWLERRPAERTRPAHDVLVQLERVRGLLSLVERRHTRQHLIDEHAECVPVDGLIVPVLRNDL
jgi:hypothetical protein